MIIEGKTCAACGKAIVRRFARAGRMHFYKSIELPIPSSVALPQCQACGQMYPDRADIQKVEKLVAVAYTEHVRRILEGALAKLLSNGIELKDLEHGLGLSAGYLNKIRSKVVPSFQLVTLLAFIADDPVGSLTSYGR